MSKFAFSNFLAFCLGSALTVVLLIADRMGKLKGPWLIGLLILAVCLTLPLPLSIPWVRDAAPPMLKFSRGALMVSVVCVIYSFIAIWLFGPATPNQDNNASESESSKAAMLRGDEPSTRPILNFECISAKVIDVAIDMGSFEIVLRPTGDARELNCKAAVADFRRNTDDTAIESVDILASAELEARGIEPILMSRCQWLVRKNRERTRSTFHRGDIKRVAIVLGVSHINVYAYAGHYTDRSSPPVRFLRDFQFLTEATYDVGIQLIGTKDGRDVVDEKFSFELIRGPRLSDMIFRERLEDRV